MTNKIPNSVIGAVSSVLAEYYYSHSTLNSLFMESGAPGGGARRKLRNEVQQLAQAV